ncbi:MAG: DUF2887 domain-containing protein, partial [Microcystaceae cyanobacterium]
PTDQAQHPLYFVEIQFQADEQLYERLRRMKAWFGTFFKLESLSGKELAVPHR